MFIVSALLDTFDTFDAPLPDAINNKWQVKEAHRNAGSGHKQSTHGTIRGQRGASLSSHTTT
jgi:hypothetical protein